MITYTCDRCHRALEVDDELAGRKVACPHCGEVATTPLASQISPAAGAVPVARPAGGVAGSGGPGSSSKGGTGSPESMGLPPRGGAEQTIRTVHPAMFRARPMYGLLLIVLIFGGVIGGGVLYFVQHQPIPAGACGVLALAGIVWAAVWKIRTKATALIITNKRTIQRRGLLSRATDEMLHDRIQDIQITQRLTQRLWNVGTLEISSAGDAGGVIDMADLPDPEGLREIIDAYRT